MPQNVLIIDTSVLCVWLKVPGKETCGSVEDRYDYETVDGKIRDEIRKGTMLVLPLATIIETGNHIAQAPKLKYRYACRLTAIIKKVIDNKSPWIAFTDQITLWEPGNLARLCKEWPHLAKTCLSLGDATIKDVANYYSQVKGWNVEILTGDEQLRAYSPVIPEVQVAIPRRRQKQN